MDILLPNSLEVKRFLNNLGRFLQSKTFSDTASYAPGITGFAIHQKSTLQLIKDEDWEESEFYDPLRDVIKTCLAYNLFEVQKVIQGKKGQQWDIYYLNRWLCVMYNLPLQFGGWNKIKPNGFIAGHDYLLGNWNGLVRYGVREAVYEFCTKYNWEIVFLTSEINNSPSFAIKEIVS